MRTLISILLVAGFLVLLLAIFGRRLQVSPFAFLPLPVWARVTVACLGLFLLGLAAWESLRVPTTALPALVTPTVSLPVTGLSAPGGDAPVIERIQTSLSSTPIGAVIQADIRFRDPDGDAYEVAYTVVNSSIPGLVVKPEQITSSPAEQAAGTDQILEWPCLGGNDIVSLKAVILDKAGHRSNIVPFVLDCG
jgi:hypothetical protein